MEQGIACWILGCRPSSRPLQYDFIRVFCQFQEPEGSNKVFLEHPWSYLHDVELAPALLKYWWKVRLLVQVSTEFFEQLRLTEAEAHGSASNAPWLEQSVTKRKF